MRTTVIQHWRVFVPFWSVLAAWVAFGLLSSVVEFSEGVARGVFFVFLPVFFGGFIVSMVRGRRHRIPIGHWVLWGMIAPAVAVIPFVLVWHSGFVVVRAVGG